MTAAAQYVAFLFLVCGLALGVAGAGTACAVDGPWFASSARCAGSGGGAASVVWRDSAFDGLWVAPAAADVSAATGLPLPHLQILVGERTYAFALVDVASQRTAVASVDCFDQADEGDRCTGGIAASMLPSVSEATVAGTSPTRLCHADGSCVTGYQSVMPASLIDTEEQAGEKPSSPAPSFRVGILAVVSVNQRARESGAQAAAVLGLHPSALGGPFALLNYADGSSRLAYGRDVVDAVAQSTTDCSARSSESTSAGPSSPWWVHISRVEVPSVPGARGFDAMVSTTLSGLLLPAAVAQSIHAAYARAIGAACVRTSCTFGLALGSNLRLGRLAARSRAALDSLLPAVVVRLARSVSTAADDVSATTVRIAIPASNLFAELECSVAEHDVVHIGPSTPRRVCFALAIDSAPEGSPAIVGTALLRSASAVLFNPEGRQVRFGSSLQPAASPDGAPGSPPSPEGEDTRVSGGGRFPPGFSERHTLAFSRASSWVARNGYVLAVLAAVGFVAVALFWNVRQRRQDWQRVRRNRQRDDGIGW
jgi:hypothetical protein